MYIAVMEVKERNSEEQSSASRHAVGTVCVHNAYHNAICGDELVLCQDVISNL